jgi:Holliday junction resolvase-like predicted endonuclease
LVSPLFWLVLFLVLIATFLALGWWWSARKGHRRATARAARAGAGERMAEVLLEQHGYAILDRQVRCLWWMAVDGEQEEVELRADLLVEKDGVRFVAEVKTGQRAPDPAYPPTRRQLLEYALAFAPYEVLLVDVEEEDIYAVTFPRARAEAER